MARVIAVTVDLEDDGENITHTIEVPWDISWSDFELMLQLAYDFDNLLIKYVDEDNDEVMISSNEELREAFRVAQLNGNNLNLKVCPVRTLAVCTADKDTPRRYDEATVPGPTVQQVAGRESVMNFETVEGEPAQILEGQCFYVKHMLSGLVLDVVGWGTAVGTPVILWEQKHGYGLVASDYSRENQLFVTHEESCTVRSHFNGLCIDATENGLLLEPYMAGKASQRWIIAGNRLQNGPTNPNWVIGVLDDSAVAGASPSTMTYQHKPSQHWVVECVSDSAEALPAGGSLGRHVYGQIVSEMTRRPSCEAGPEPSPGPASQRPEWFTTYMDMFKRDLCEEVSIRVARRVMRNTQGSPPDASPGANPLAISEGDSSNVPAQHYGITCDSCKLPIVGIRYKCGNCVDFDLCEECERCVAEWGLHDRDHVFVKLRRPAWIRHKHATGCTLLKRTVYLTDTEIKKMADKMLCKQQKSCRRDERRMEKWRQREEKGRQHEEKGRQREEKGRQREEKLKRRREMHRSLPNKKERLDLPEYQDADFVEDENYLDGSVLPPGSTITKRWLMSNTGHCNWDSNTKLSLMWGNIPTVASEVPVPPTEPNDMCSVSVELITPMEPGVYQSHWRMSHKNVRFGHRVWCSIVVKPSPGTEPTTATVPAITAEDEEVERTTEKTQAATGGEGCDGTEMGNGVSLLSEQDIMSFDMLAIRERVTPKVSQTATPTNTPMVLTPPKSPVCGESMGHPLSTSSSVEIVSESSEENASRMTQLVHERIATLGLKPDHLDDYEMSSTCSDDSGADSESDFYVVPMPSCFNPNLPLSSPSSSSSSSSTSNVLVTRAEVMKVMEEVMGISKKESEAASPAQAPAEPDLPSGDDEALDMELVEVPAAHEEMLSEAPPEHEDTLDDVSLLAFEMPPSDMVEVKVTDENNPTVLPKAEPEAPSEQEAPREQEAPCEQEAQEPEARSQEQEALRKPEVMSPDVLSDENANSVPTTPEGATNIQASGPLGGETMQVGALDLTQEGSTAENPIVLDAESGETDTARPVTPAKAPVTPPAVPVTPPRPSPLTPESPSSSTLLASTLMTAALGAATQAYTTAKDVFHTLQANNQYVPPKSNWTPTAQQWSPPPQDDFTLPKQKWSPPPQQAWAPPVWAGPTTTSLSSMELLVEMGFANRERNRELLAKHEQDMQKVVQELVSGDDNEWHQSRH